MSSVVKQYKNPGAMNPHPPTDPFSEIPIAPPSDQGRARKPVASAPSPFQPQFSRQHLSPKKQPSAAPVFVILGLVAIATLLAGYFGVPLLIKTMGTRALAHYLARPVTIGHVEFNPFTLRLTMANGIIGPRLSDPTDKVDPLISFATLTIDLDARSLLRRAFICQELSLSQPFLHLVHDQGHSYNISSLLRTGNPASPAIPSSSTWLSALISPRYSINNIAITKGEILYDDLPNAKVQHLQDLNFCLPAFANIDYQNGQIKPHFSAVVNGTPIQMSGQAQMAEGKMTASLNLKMNNLDLATYKDYLASGLGLQAVSGHADLDLNLLYAAASAPADRLRLAGSIALRATEISSKHGQLSIDSGLIKGGFSPASNQFQAEEINLHHPIWQRPSGQAGLLDTVQPLLLSGPAPANKSWAATIAAFFPPSPMPGPMLPISHLQITNGEIRELSKTGNQLPSDWQAIDISINTAQLSGDQAGQQQALFTMNAKQAAGSRLSLQGSASSAPFEAKGLLVISHADIAMAQKVWQRFGAALPVQSGSIEQIQTNFSITLNPDQRPKFLLDPLSIQAKDLRIERYGQLLEIPVWQSEQGSFTPSEPTLHLGRVQLQQPTLSCKRQSSSATWQTFLSSPVAQGPEAVTPIDLRALELTNASLLIENIGPPDIRLRLARLDLQIDQLDPQQENTVSVAALLSDKYPIQANGSFSLTPFSASLNIQASDLPLATFQPIFERYFITPLNGTLSVDGTLSLPSLAYQGKWTIDSLSAPPLSCRNLSAEGSSLSLRPLRLSIDSLSLQAPALQVAANHNGMPELPPILKPGWQPANSKEEATFTIKTIDLEAGSLVYDLPDQAESAEGTPRGGVALSGKKITGSIEDFIVAKDQTIPFNFKGLLETRAEFQVQGVIRPFAARPALELKSQITGLPLLAIAPLLEPYWGFTVKAGTLDFENHATYEDTLINDNSTLSLHDLSLGKPIAAPAIKALGDTWQSLPLVQALLQDKTDTITLALPIDGRTDTGFTYKTAVKAFLNQLLLKATVSPMNLLSSNQETPGDMVLFQPGSSQLEAAAEDQLNTLAALLRDRPLLWVRLAGFADSATDSPGLLAQKKVSPSQDPALGIEKKLLTLANMRTQAVQKILINQGVSTKQLRLLPSALLSTENAGHSGGRVAITFSGRE